MEEKPQTQRYELQGDEPPPRTPAPSYTSIIEEKRRAQRYELQGDDPLEPTLTPSYSGPQKAASDSNPADAIELPADPIPFWDTIGDSIRSKDNGRVDIDCASKLMRTLSVLHQPLPEKAPASPLSEHFDATAYPTSWATKLNIVIQVVGSRGDVQPFVALGSELQRYGHRVRLATHDVFRRFVRDSGLEFYPIGGDPAELMAYMVKNPGLIPSMKRIAAGEVTQKRYMVQEMLEKCWESCLRQDPLTGEPFVADAIIANPPSLAHIHCAQALGIPVHLMFTMPWSNTTAFPHPLANLKNVEGDLRMANYVSYSAVEWMMWQGLGDIVNKWRRSIDLEEVAMFDAPMLSRTLKIPFTYCWSPALVPKPIDWPSHIDVCGFFFRDAPKYSPPPDLAQFLAAGPLPIYIGFGSIVLDDPDRMIRIILDAVQAVGIRAIISKGWSSLAGPKLQDVYWIGDCPHEWLFQHVAAVVHHGGADTTACGLRNAKPTAIVPFFGDQPFWGNMVANAAAGPRPIPYADLTADNLARGIRYCLSEQAAAAAASIAAKIGSEAGVRAAARSFHRQLPLEQIRCDLIPSEPAVWAYSKSKRPIKLSKVAAQTVLSNTSTESKHMKIYQSNPIVIETTRWDPISGGALAVIATTTELAGSVTGVVTKPIEEYRNVRQQRARELKQLAAQSPATASQTSHHEARGTTDSIGGRASTESSPSRSTKSPYHSGSTVGKMAGASAKSIGSFAPTALKGMVADIPLAITEGMKSVPLRYGGSVRDHGQVTNAKSGAVVAGKTFAWGFADGISDLVVEPYKGAVEGGAMGSVKGVGKGVTSLVAKTGAGMFGVFAYPATGIGKSLRATVHTKTRKAITQERYAEGKWMVQTGRAPVDTDEVISAFARLRESNRPSDSRITFN